MRILGRKHLLSLCFASRFLSCLTLVSFSSSSFYFYFDWILLWLWPLGNMQGRAEIEEKKTCIIKHDNSSS